MDEKVPVKIANVITSANGRMTSPPKITRASVADMVVPCVRIDTRQRLVDRQVQDAVEVRRRYLRRFSRTRSKMMMVSFSE